MPRGYYPRKPPASPDVRFWRFVEKGDGCWLWTGGTAGAGYGSFTIRENGKQRTTYAHRFSYELHHGAIPAGLFVCHRCDNPACVHPGHLFAGTPTDNQQDMIAKGRKVVPQRTYTHCTNGHEYTPENTQRSKRGMRRCKTCNSNRCREWQGRRGAEWKREWRAARKAAGLRVS
jgi:hypothetical protein